MDGLLWGSHFSDRMLVLCVSCNLRTCEVYGSTDTAFRPLAGQVGHQYIGLSRASASRSYIPVFCWYTSQSSIILPTHLRSTPRVLWQVVRRANVFNIDANTDCLHPIVNVWRNTIGAVFPLFGSNVYDSLGIHGAGSLVAGIATVLAVVPFIGFAYGGRIRAKSRFAREMEEMKAQADRK